MRRKAVKIIAMVALVAAVMCVPLLVGSTYATSENQLTFTGAQFALYQRDVATGTQNEIVNGSADPVFKYELWEPGYTVTEYFTLRCDSADDFTYSFQLKCTNGELTKLAGVIDVYYLETDTQLSGDRQSALSQMNYLGTLDEALKDNTLFTGSGNGQVSFAVALQMRQGAGNEYQGLSLYAKDGAPQYFNVILTASANP